MKKKKKDKQRFMKTIFKDMGKLLSNINEDSICTWCALLDYDLLSLTDESDAKKFSNKYSIFPGYNWFLTSVYLLTEISDSSKLLSNDITNKFSKLLDEMVRKNIKRLGLSVTSQLGNPQAQWQKNYIFKTYLLYLFLSEPDVNNKLKSITNLSSFEISSICLYNKLFSQPEMKLKAE